LKYVALVWDPHLAKDINKLENIQRRSARFVKGDYHTTSSVTQMLQELGWQDLQSRRRDLRLAVLYKVVMGHVGIQPEHVGLVAADDRSRAKHQSVLTYKWRPIMNYYCVLIYSVDIFSAGITYKQTFQEETTTTSI